MVEQEDEVSTTASLASSSTSTGVNDGHTWLRSLAIMDVAMPPPGWDWELTTCLGNVMAGDEVWILQRDKSDPDWLWARSGDRQGWFPESAVRLADASVTDALQDADGASAVSQFPQNLQAVAVADVVVPAPGWTWDHSTCLAVAAGEEVWILFMEEGENWIYGRSGHGEGWLPRQSVRLMDESECGGCAGDGRVGSQSRLLAVADVTVPPPGWDWDPSTCLAVAAGDEVCIIAEDDDDWIYARCGHRMGWLPRGAVASASPAPVGVQPVAERSGSVAVVKRPVTEPPEGMDDANFLLPLCCGEEVLVEHAEEDWVWGRVGERLGWAPTWALGAADGEGQEEEAISEEALASLRPGELRRRLLDMGVQIPVGTVEKNELVALFLAHGQAAVR